MRRRRLIAIGIVAGCLLGLLAAVPALSTVKWVGSRDLAVRFVVVDGATGHPVPEAAVQIEQAKSSRCETEMPEEFVLATDGNGTAAKTVKRCMTFGSRGLFEDTYYSHVPRWTFHVRADGYQPSRSWNLEEPEFARLVRRGENASELTVRIELSSDVSQVTRITR
jgi:hypothetical protein